MDLRTFKSRANWYQSRGIPYRRGYLLYGPPGTGKTSTIQAVAAFLDYNIAIISSITSMTNEKLCELIRCVPYNTVIVIEDVDHLFTSASSSKATAKMTMSGLLNVMDGVNSSKGSIIFMTCNNMDKLEPAMLRPGRIDVKLHLDYAAPEQIEDTFWRFMGIDDTEESSPLSEQEKDKAKKHATEFLKMIPGHEITTAELQSFFIDLLLEANAEKWEREYVYKVMYERVPKFLEKVKLDREQAANHRRKVEKEEEEEAKAEDNKEVEEEKEEEEKKESVDDE
jgi:SpoVK/Ycf46/Vps4 family AAA+-type ATPase